jgi:hypothetical protein
LHREAEAKSENEASDNRAVRQPRQPSDDATEPNPSQSARVKSPAAQMAPGAIAASLIAAVPIAFIGCTGMGVR